jgi:hypothetical protein
MERSMWGRAGVTMPLRSAFVSAAMIQAMIGAMIQAMVPLEAIAQPDDRGASTPEAQAPAKAEPPAVPFPHPLITEVLYAVPSGDEGDADGDGVRSATGDEFVELINPHTKPIRLKGYVLTDGRNLLASGGSGSAKREPSTSTKKTPGTSTRDTKDKDDASASVDRKNRIRFEFPDITLQPGQVVVVFNGYKGKNTKAVGEKSDDSGDDETGATKDSQTQPAPEKPAPKRRAKPGPGEPPAPIRLSMKVTSQYAAFANAGDCVLLLDPKGNGIHCIAWGEKSKPPEDAAPLLERAPEGKGSATRVRGSRGLGEHRLLDAEARLFSPGEHSLIETAPEPEVQTPTTEVPPLESPEKPAAAPVSTPK